MKIFLQRFSAFVLGVLCGFDRLRLRGKLLSISTSITIREKLVKS